MIVTHFAELLPESDVSVPAASSPPTPRPAVRARTTTSTATTTRPNAMPLERDAFAKLISPPADARCHDELFGRFRRDLIDQICPTRTTQQWTIDHIAADMVLLMRVRQAIELLMTPATLTQEVIQAARLAREDQKRAKLLQRLLDACVTD